MSNRESMIAIPWEVYTRTNFYEDTTTNQSTTPINSWRLGTTIHMIVIPREGEEDQDQEIHSNKPASSTHHKMPNPKRLLTEEQEKGLLDHIETFSCPLKDINFLSLCDEREYFYGKPAKPLRNQAKSAPTTNNA